MDWRRMPYDLPEPVYFHASAITDVSLSCQFPENLTTGIVKCNGGDISIVGDVKKAEVHLFTKVNPDNFLGWQGAHLRRGQRRQVQHEI